jgi:Ca2+-binding RTX toxin-like protein
MPIAYPELGFIFLDAGELSDDYTLSADGAYRNLWGNGDANRLEGNTFDNYINGDGGIDTLVGGQGNDTYRVDQPDDVITELAGEGIDTVWSNVDYTLGANVENLFLDEGGGPNITGTGNELANRRRNRRRRLYGRQCARPGRRTSGRGQRYGHELRHVYPRGQTRRREHYLDGHRGDRRYGQ